MSRVSGFVLSAVVFCLVCTPTSRSAHAQSPDGSADPLAVWLQPYLDAFAGKTASFEVRGQAKLPIDGKSQVVDFRIERFDDEAFDLDLSHSDYALRIRRRSDATALALPKHNVVFVGKGKLEGPNKLSPAGISERLFTSRTTVSTYVTMATHANGPAVSAMLKSMLGVRFDPQSGQGNAGDSVSFRQDDNGSLHVEFDDGSVKVSITSGSGEMAGVESWSNMELQELSREELERTLVRGCRRAMEVFAPSKVLTEPLQRDRQVEHGRLIWIDGHRVALLDGSPSEIGTAHGQLLRTEAQACIDSVLYGFGAVETIRSGRWFRHELDAAYARLAPHIPERHKTEMRALADALELDQDLVLAVNVFPELFHCSGFAVFDSATQDGKLYHGRVLDYMTTIGLQDSATTFIVKADDCIPFANVGYASFIGSVSGMNAKAVSVGEMGGGGQGQWDGVPMATLMRRALEECNTLDEVIDLWTNSPRTCEYYYVFADGKSNQAVGVAALPESIEFIQPGQSHERLGKGIPDAVVLSAGDRLEKLRERVQKEHGNIDADLAKWLMSRPVAMESNLHNVLFVPEDGVLYVANADHEKPAAERPYVRLDLNALLRQIDSTAPAGRLSKKSSSGAVLP